MKQKILLLAKALPARVPKIWVGYSVSCIVIVSLAAVNFRVLLVSKSGSIKPSSATKTAQESAKPAQAGQSSSPSNQTGGSAGGAKGANPAGPSAAKGGTSAGQISAAQSSSSSGSAKAPSAPAPTVPFAANSPWNTPFSASTRWQANAALGSTHWWVNDETYSAPVVYTSSSYPSVAIQVPYGWGWPAQTLHLNIAAGVSGASGSDGSLVVISGSTVYNFFGFNRTDNTHATVSSYALADINGSGWGTLSPFKGAGIRAAGASELGGLIMGNDVAGGSINHALAASLDVSLVSSSFVAPAIASDGSGGTIPEGTRLGIPSNVAMPAGLSDVGKMVWNTLQKYGAYVVDRSSGNALYADPNSVPQATINPLRVWWGTSGHSDLDLIMPHLEIAQ